MLQYPPYDSTAWVASSDNCDYCEDGAEFDIHRHHFYVSRDGARARTADNLAAVFAVDVAELVGAPDPFADGGYYGAGTSEDGRVSYRAVEFPEGWCEDADDSQALSDGIQHFESLLADAGLYAYWDDGYVIERVEEAP